jgi:hypothetical protein
MSSSQTVVDREMFVQALRHMGEPEFDTKRCKYLIYIDRVRELPLQEA